jgi:DNA polymerase-3 subunit delta'
VSAPVLDRIVGQQRATRLLRASLAGPVHAYLFVGPPGSGRREAALAFGAALVCPDGGCGKCEACREALAERHPDVVVVERVGASISVPQAQEVTRLSLRTPRAAPYQVLVLVDFHLVTLAAPALLKTIEEPPDTTVIVVIADSVPADFVTIASRCVRVEFDPLSEAEVALALERDGVEPGKAQAVAQAAGGRIDRARLLVRDEGFAERLERWRQIPARLDGTGATVVLLAEELIAGANEPVEVVKARQAEELAHLAALAEQAGERAVPGRPVVEERHRREQRRVRTDELRAGLAALSATYRDRLADGRRAAGLSIQLRAIDLVNEASERLTRNPNEALLLEWLLVRLDSLT